MTTGADLPPAMAQALSAAGLPLITDADVLAGHCVDWTGRWSGRALGEVRPTSTEQVSRVLAAAQEFGVAIQVQGGNTGLVGGSVPAEPALLLRTDRLGLLGPVDTLERTVVVGAGVTAAQLAAHASAAGLHFAVDLAARDSATVGGMVATNAGGLGVLAYGMMRDQVRGLVVVLADGRVVGSTGRPRKDNCGYDLTALLAGSEGTLGVITKVEVALHAPTAATTVAGMAVADLATAVRAARRVQTEGWLLTAAEVVDAAGVARAATRLGVADPLPAEAAWLLLLEVADSGTAEGVAAVAEDVVAVGVTTTERQRLWSLRECQTELYASLPVVHKLDVGARLADLDALVSVVRGAVTELAPDATVGVFGHAVDGNLHVQIVGGDADVAAVVLSAVADQGGTISAEHGIGRAKAAQLSLARSAEHIALMRAIKATVDPRGLVNRGVLLQAEGASTLDAG